MDLECFTQVVALLIFVFRLRHKPDGHLPVAQAVEQIIGFFFNLRQCLLNEQRRNAIFTKSTFQGSMLDNSLLERFAFLFKFCLAGTLRIEDIHALFGAAQLTACFILAFPQTEKFTLGLIQNEGDTLQMIENCLERIEDGTYGQCEECSVRIPKTRLNAIPYSVLCVRCAEQQENGF